MRNLVAEARIFAERHELVGLEIVSRLYNVEPYFFAKTLVGMPLQVLFTAVFLAIVIPMIGLRAANTPLIGLFMVLLGLSADGVGFLVGALIFDEATVNLVTPLVMFATYLFTGFVAVNVPPPIGWIAPLTFFRYGLSALASLELKGRTFRNIDGEDIDGEIIWAEFAFAPLSVPMCAMCLCVYLILARVLALMALKRRVVIDTYRD